VLFFKKSSIAWGLLKEIKVGHRRFRSVDRMKLGRFEWTDEHKKLLPYVLATLGGLVGFFLILFIAVSVLQSPRTLTSKKYSFSWSGFVNEFLHLSSNLQAKLDRIRKSSEENERLRLENMNLKLSFEGMEYACNAKTAQKTTEEFELKLSKETSAKVGRSLAGINYQVPAQLFPSQLYTLALAYFVGREDEKAAVLLTYLTGQEENATYKTAKDYLLTGVSWFRIENYTLADSYFDDVLKVPDSELSLPYQAQARLWKAVVADKLQKKLKTQYWLKELVDHHPYATESQWVNLAASGEAGSEDHSTGSAEHAAGTGEHSPSSSEHSAEGHSEHHSATSSHDSSAGHSHHSAESHASHSGGGG
jgi:hypothetical protein